MTTPTTLAPLPPAGSQLGHSYPDLPPTCNFVLDLETLGTMPTSAILQIGVTCIESRETVAIQIGEAYGTAPMNFTTNAHTRDWWLKQDMAVREEVFATGLCYEYALGALSDWLKAQSKLTNVPLDRAMVWANDPEFDCVILQHAYLNVSFNDYPFNFRNHRSFRTLNAQMLETLSMDVWSGNAEERYANSIKAAYYGEEGGVLMSTGWEPVRHTAHGDSVLEACAIIELQNVLYRTGCMMNMLRSTMGGWNLTRRS